MRRAADGAPDAGFFEGSRVKAAPRAFERETLARAPVVAAEALARAARVEADGLAEADRIAGLTPDQRTAEMLALYR